MPVMTCYHKCLIHSAASCRHNLWPRSLNQKVSTARTDGPRNSRLCIFPGHSPWPSHARRQPPLMTCSSSVSQRMTLTNDLTRSPAGVYTRGGGAAPNPRNGRPAKGGKTTSWLDRRLFAPARAPARAQCLASYQLRLASYPLAWMPPQLHAEGRVSYTLHPA